MRLRSVYLLLMLMVNPQLFAATPRANWDCQRNEDTKEWVCVTKQKQPAQETEEPAATPQIVKQPAPIRPTQQPLEIQPVFSVQKPGWTCTTDAEGSGWDCTLVGPDPKDQVQIAEQGEGETGFTPAISTRETEIYDNMLGRIPFDPWALCTSQLGPSVSGDVGVERDQAPMDIESDYTDVFEEEIVSFSGDVEFTRADQKVWADQATYDLESKILNASGNVYYHQQGLSLFSDRAFIKLASDRAHLTNSTYILDSTPARGRAAVTYQDNKSLYRFKDVSYTTCRPSNQDWALYADHLKVDREAGRAEALNAWFKVKGVPVLYTPYISFPIDDRRKSGFLAPTFGSTDETGFDFTAPYYWNIAPNFDMTFSPRVMSKRGIMLGSEFRYLTEASNTELRLELVPHDSERGETRGQASLINQTRISPSLRFDMDGNYLSDDDYLDELGNTLSISNSRHVESQANLRYNWKNISILGKLEHFQTIDSDIPSNARPYRRLPQLLLNINQPLGSTGAEFDLESEFVYFDRGDSVTGQRLNIQPRLHYTMETPSVFLRPSVSLAHTQYWLDDPNDTFSNSVDRTLPVVSVDSGVFLERDLTLFDNGFLQTLEPRLFYLYIPDDDQDDIPLFDTSLFDFSFDQLFREYRFNGTDRIGDANQVSVALTSRFLEKDSGKERLNASVGQIFFFEDREVVIVNDGQDGFLRDAPPETNSTSNLVTELNALIIDGLNFRSTLQWNPDNSLIERGQASLTYREGLSKIFNISYRFRKIPGTDQTTVDQGDISFRWPIFPEIHAVGRWQYSFLDNLTLESFFGFEKESCCWRFRLLGRHYVNDVNSDAQTGIFIQLEFKGFTSFGDQVDQFLESNISGFTIPEE